MIPFLEVSGPPRAVNASTILLRRGRLSVAKCKHFFLPLEIDYGFAFSSGSLLLLIVPMVGLKLRRLALLPKPADLHWNLFLYRLKALGLKAVPTTIDSPDVLLF